MSHNTFMAIGFARELGIALSTEDAQKLFEFIRAAYNRGMADALPMHADLVAEAVAAEREAVASMVESGAPPHQDHGNRVEIGCSARKSYAAAIRARGGNV